MNASWAVRVLRAAVFAAMCVTLSAAAHRLASGTAPPVWADGAGFLAVLAFACPLGGRERSLTGIGGAMLTVQAVLHFAFDAARPRTPGLTMPGNPMPSAMDAPGAPGAHAVTVHGAVAHLVAALLAAWWLHRGETAFWSLLRRARTLAPGLAAWWRARPGPAVLIPGPRTTPPGPAPVQRLVLRHAVSRRGPPAPAPPRALCAVST